MVMKVEVPASLTPNAKSAVIYLTIVNRGNEADTLLAITTPRAKAATLHETTMQDDIMKMRELDGLEIPAGREVMLEAGAKHIMLTGLSAGFKEGEVVPLEMTFEKAGLVTLEAVVGKPTARN
jgi:periplasmic copper chaperone A